MNKDLQVIISEQGIEESDAKRLAEAFGGPFQEAGSILLNFSINSKKELVPSKDAVKVTEEDDLEGMKKAREQRLILKKARTTVENKRKELKDNIVKQGNAIDAVARFVKEQIKPAEDYLKLQEEFAGIKAMERAAAKKAERIEKLSQYSDNLSLYNLDDINDEQFDELLSTLKSQHEAKIAEAKRIEEERIARERAEAEEREKIKLENERLKAEAESREAELEKERKQREAEEAKRQEIERKAQEKRDAEEAERLKKEQIERDRIQAEADAKLKAEREQREKLEAEVRAKEQAEKDKREQAEREEQEARNASDMVKLTKFSEAIEMIRREKLPVVSEKNRSIVNSIDAKLAEIQVIIAEGLTK